jgi:hypothetical protein
VLKDQKCETKSVNNIMDNFYHDFNVKEDNKGHIKKLELRENTKTERNMSIDKQKIISHRAGSKENR